MICVVFYKKREGFIGFTTSGHAGFAKKGEDIVCAAVSSAVQLTVNALTDVLGLDCIVRVEEKDALVSITLQEESAEAQHFFQAFLIHLQDLKDRYHGKIDITNMEDTSND